MFRFLQWASLTAMTCSCSLIAPFDVSGLPHRPDADVQADAEGETDADTDGDGWIVLASDCGASTDFIDNNLEHHGCGTLAELGVEDVTITESCSVDTTNCEWTCTPIDVARCFVGPADPSEFRGGGICTIAARNFTLAVGETIELLGTNGFAIVAAETIVVGGTIDASAHGQDSSPGGWLGGSAGAPGEAQPLELDARGGAGRSPGGGGGGGGHFGGGGGGGCTPNSGGEAVIGCQAPDFNTGAGGGGGAFDAACEEGAGGVGGAGGGFVFLFARELFHLLETGHITANGADGQAPNRGCALAGGGGGGSGGMIWITSTAVALEGHLIARGGRGGSGSGSVPGGEGGGSTVANGRSGECSLEGTGPGGGGGGAAGFIYSLHARRWEGPGLQIEPNTADCLAVFPACIED